MVFRSFIVALVAALAVCAAHALQPPPGWQRIEANGAELYQPGDLQAGEVFQVMFFPRTSMGADKLDAWFKKSVANDAAGDGEWRGAPQFKEQTANMFSATRAWSDARGKSGSAIYYAISLDGLVGRIARLLLNESPAMQRHKQAALDLVAQLAPEEMRAAKAEQRPTDIEAAPPAVKGIKVGGPLMPGRYVGNFSSDNKVLRRFDLLLHANGEFEFLEGGSSINPTGKFKYAEGSGKLDIQDPLWNSKYDPDEDFCLYGRNAKGEQVIYAEDYYGLGTHVALLKRVGDVDRLPPTQAKNKKEQEEAEAARYKFVTAPGKGLAANGIEAVMHRWEQVYEVGGLQLHDYAYLLLKDGTVYQGLPVPPEDMDVAASKKNEPKSWGRWRKNGSTYEFAWADAPGKFEAMQQTSVVMPAKHNERAQGTWTGASSYSMPGGAGAWQNWGLTLSADGRFEQFRSGGYGSGLSGEVSGTGVTTGAVYDDEGASSVVIAPSFGGGSTTKSEKTKADRSGKYVLNGYTLELRYDNGVVVRLPFFWNDAKRDMVWFEGSMLMAQQPEKK